MAETAVKQAIATDIENGAIEEIDGCKHIYFDGYWIRYYAPPPETFSAKRDLIIALTKRTFHHTEDGINTPGENLELARKAFNQQADADCKRVNGAMLAGALFNRATDLFTAIVELEQKGVKISPDNELMKQCAECFHEALELGQQVKHHSGHEGVDELWGEPLKAFTLPIADFYRSRYIKIAQTMRDIDKIITHMIELFSQIDAFDGIEQPLQEFGEAAKNESEAMKSDPDIFDIWPRFVASGEKIHCFEPTLCEGVPLAHRDQLEKGRDLLREGGELVSYLAGVRVPMPKSTMEFLQSCDTYKAECQRLGIIHKAS